MGIYQPPPRRINTPEEAILLVENARLRRLVHRLVIATGILLAAGTAQWALWLIR